VKEHAAEWQEFVENSEAAERLRLREEVQQMTSPFTHASGADVGFACARAKILDMLSPTEDE
jgi:hypothetical protein